VIELVKSTLPSYRILEHRMTFCICDRCGDITVDSDRCICATPYDSAEFRRRHHAAVEAARATADRAADIRVRKARAA
jgi:hypothetical protein